MLKYNSSNNNKESYGIYEVYYSIVFFVQYEYEITCFHIFNIKTIECSLLCMHVCILFYFFIYVYTWLL